MSKLSLPSIVSLAVLNLAVHAAGQHFDIGVQLDNDQLVTGSSFEFSSFVYPVRVFTGDFTSAAEGFDTNDPGYFSLASTSTLLPSGLDFLPINTYVHWDFLAMTVDNQRSNLYHWDALDDGGGLSIADVDFVPSSGVQIDLFSTVGDFASIAGEEELVEGGRLFETEFDGSVHQHPFLDIRSTVSGDFPEGVYLLSLQLSADGFESSEPYFLALRTFNSDPTAADIAADWVEANLDMLLSEPLAGDFNADGLVDAADYTVWRDGYSSGGYTIDDYEAWRENFGAGGGAGSIASVPEPAMALPALALACLGVLRRR